MADVKECCADLGKRAEGAGPRGLAAPAPEGVTVTHCVECECRHFEATIDPLVLDFSGAGL